MSRDPEKRREYQKLYRQRPEEKAKRSARSKQERLEDPSRIRKNIKSYKIRLKAEVFACRQCSKFMADVWAGRSFLPNQYGA